MPERASRRSACASATRRSRRRSADRSTLQRARCTARRRRSSTTGARSSRGLSCPLTVGRYHSLVVDARAARLPGGVRARRRRADGPAPPRAAGRGRAVPPRVGAHRAGQGAARATSSTAASPAGAESSAESSIVARRLMPNPILTRAIDALAARRDLSADETAEVLAADHARRGLRDADRRVSDRAAHEGRDGR